jgi:hypothetical protein
VIAIISSKSPIFFKVTDDLETFVRDRSHAFHVSGTVAWNCWIGDAGGISCHCNWYARSIYFGRGEEGGEGGGNMIFRLKWIGGER